MFPFSFIGIFCEDVRDEVGGTHSIVGVLPDNVSIGSLPGMIPRLGIYIRIQLVKDANPKTLKARVKLPGGAVHEIADFSQLIEPVKEEAEKNNLPFAGLIAKGVLSPVPIRQGGMIKAIVEMDGTEYICGVLNLVQPELAATGSTPADLLN